MGSGSQSHPPAPSSKRGHVCIQTRAEWAKGSARAAEPLLLRCSVEGSHVTGLAFSHRGDLLVVGQETGSFELFETATFSPVARYEHPGTGGVVCLFSPADDLLAPRETEIDSLGVCDCWRVC